MTIPPTPAMSRLLKRINPVLSVYKDRKFRGDQQAFEHALHTSTTVYVGNLAFWTTEEQLYEVRDLSHTCCPCGSAVSLCSVVSSATHASTLLNTEHLPSTQVFSKVGDVRRIIMGLDRVNKTPCGFCFVLYYTRDDTDDCVKYINGTMLDERPIRVDFDWGFEEGRQFGRGRSGGQVRDEYRQGYDPGRLAPQKVAAFGGMQQPPPAKRQRPDDGR